MAAAPGTTPQITWQEAVARLARERTAAETCAALLKKHGDAAAIASGALAYGEAKAEYDGIIAGLRVALARKGVPKYVKTRVPALTCGRQNPGMEVRFEGTLFASRL